MIPAGYHKVFHDDTGSGFACHAGGEIFALHMGKLVRILDMSGNLIRLSGYEPYVDMPIEFTGLRLDEKRYEELLMEAEGLRERLDELYEVVIHDENGKIKDMVKELVPTYRSQM